MLKSSHVRPFTTGCPFRSRTVTSIKTSCEFDLRVSTPDEDCCPFAVTPFIPASARNPHTIIRRDTLFDLANESLRLETFRYRWLNAYPVHSSRLRSILPSAPGPMLRGGCGMYFLHPSAYEIAKTRPAVQNRSSQSEELFRHSVDHPCRGCRVVLSLCRGTAGAAGKLQPASHHSRSST